MRFAGWPSITSLGVALLLAAAPPGSLAAQETGGVGRIAGRVVDAATGEGLTNVEVTVVGTSLGGRTDLDGRYTILSVPVGAQSVVARRIGLQPKQFDGVQVEADRATVVNFTLGEVVLELQSVVVSADASERSASEAGLLAAQRRAASASDGVSSEQISRTPDSNAGEAATRVSGVSIVGGKFLIARGLSERYSTTLLNGAEVASPEPARKIVPLDVFPASLLESIVVTKSATPDKPGDFSGGAVEIKTKEFPDNPIREFKISQGYNSQATFRSLPFPGRSGLDYLAADNGRRSPPPLPDSGLGNPFVVERFVEGIRSDWSPPPAAAMPNLGLGFTLGGQRPSDRAALGYVISANYSAGHDHQQDRFFAFYAAPDGGARRGFVYQDFQNTVDWGGVANFSLRLGRSTKLGWKNLYTRGSEELYSESEGFNADFPGALRNFQFRYIERDLLQTQLTGDHLLPFLGDSRLEWKTTISQSGRNEPDNRQLQYERNEGGLEPRFGLSLANNFFFRDLADRQLALQADWQKNTNLLWTPVTFKVGALSRTKRRQFDGRLVSLAANRSPSVPTDVQFLPPQQLQTGENIGPFLFITFPGSVTQPYDVDDNLTAAYGMFDMLMGSRVRMVAGARLENWNIDLFNGGRELATAGDSLAITRRRDRDVLLSANATITVGPRTNLRLAVFQSVSRPDTRELSLDEYTDVAGTCSTIGNPNLQRARILNADARLEWFPNPGEIISASAFYKTFDRPIIRTVIARSVCTYTYENAESAQNFGAELDIRKNLYFLPGLLQNLSASLNLTLVQTSVTIDPRFGTYEPGLDLEGQSPYVVNTGLSYQNESGSFSGSILLNRFDDRVVRYGFQSAGQITGQGPNIVERGRSSLDVKLQRRFGESTTVSLSGRNLNNAQIQFFQSVDTGDEQVARSIPGVNIQLGVSIAR